MSKIIALFSVLIPHLSATTTRQLSQVVLALLSMTGRVTMLNISRWTGQGGSYRTVQRFFNTVIPWTTICWTFFRTYLLDRESDYILVGDEVVVPKAGKSTYGLSRFFSSLFGKAIPGLSFLAVSLVSVDRKRSYPMVMEQIVRGTPSSNQGVCASERQANTETATPKHKRGRPKGSRNRNKNVVVLSDVLKQLQTMVKGLLQQIGNLIRLRYFVLDYFVTIMRYKWRNNVGYISFQNYAPMLPCIFHRRHLMPERDAPAYTASVSTHDRLTQNTVSLPTRFRKSENRSVSNGSTPQKVRRRTERGLHSLRRHG